MPPLSAAASISTTRPSSPQQPPETSQAGQSVATNAPASRSGRLTLWWDRLLRLAPSPNYFTKDDVRPNDTHIPCPDNPSTIRINGDPSSPSDGIPIHASRFKITRTLPATATIETATYAIGQSPCPQTVEDFLVAGLESKKGLYQFVSERTHGGKQSRSNTAVVQLLENKLKKLRENEVLTLGGGRYTVTSFAPVTQEPAIAGCRQYRLIVTDKDNPDHPITVPITQAGLPFQNALLTADAIERASTMMDQHQEALARPNTKKAKITTTTATTATDP